MEKQHEHIVRSYEEELSLLNNKVAKMGGLAEQVLGQSIDALERRDPQLAAATIKEVVGHYLARTGLTRFAKYYPHQLSGGMRQRVSIARAFANDPEILLMDEPFSALDAQNKVLLQEELLHIWEEHKKTVVFITHSVDEAVFLGDRIMVMTAQPGKVKTFVEVPLARPRNIMELQKTPEYGELIADIWSSLRDEVQRARAQEETK